MVEELARAEREVRRRDDRDGVRADLQGVAGGRDRVPRRLRSRVDRDLEAIGPGGEEGLGDVLAFVDREEDTFARGAAGEEAVDAPVREEPNERCDGIRGDVPTPVLERR